MKSFFLSICAVIILMSLPRAVFAAEVGFVPSTSIWFSKQSMVVGETVKVYSVIINNGYPAVSADIAFYDNGNQIGKVSIEKLEKEQAREFWIDWTPSAGQHKITARFIRAFVIGQDGKQTALDSSILNTISGNSGEVLSSGDPVGSVTSNGAATAPTTNDVSQGVDTLVGSGVTVQVQQDGSKLMLAIDSGSTSDKNIDAQKGAVTGKEVTVTSNGIATSSESALSKELSPKTIIDRAKNIFETITDKIKNVGETIRHAREVTVSTASKAQTMATQSKVVARDLYNNKVAFAWVGFFIFLVLVAFLSYRKWRRY